jgi:hypothetical protein
MENFLPPLLYSLATSDATLNNVRTRPPAREDYEQTSQPQNVDIGGF